MKSVVIWCDLNSEQDELENLLGDKCFSIRGSTPMDKKIDYEERWRKGERPILVTKASVMGWGMNWQHSQTAIFCGMDYSFEGYYQAVRRIYRFGQTQPVHIYRVMGSTELNILKTINAKQTLHNEMHGGMQEAMKRRANVQRKHFFKKAEREEYSAFVPDWLKSEGEAS